MKWTEGHDSANFHLSSTRDIKTRQYKVTHKIQCKRHFQPMLQVLADTELPFNKSELWCKSCPGLHSGGARHMWGATSEASSHAMPEGHHPAMLCCTPYCRSKNRTVLWTISVRFLGTCGFVERDIGQVCVLKDSISRFPRMRGKRRMFVDGGKSNCAGLIDHMLINKRPLSGQHIESLTTQL